MNNNFLLVEKYRPKSIEECILPKSIKNTFDEFVNNSELPNLLLHGKSGVGKTSVARALCKDLGLEYILINASEEGNIDTLRTKIKNFASTVSLNQKMKVVILDEADHLNPQSTQPALRGFIEEYADNCRFVFTCNYPNKIIDTLHSRCVSIDFKIPSTEAPELGKLFLKRIIQILNEEKIEYDIKAVTELLKKYWPDFRKILNEIQRYGISGRIDAGILTSIEAQNYETLLNALKAKDIRETKKWIIQNLDTEAASIIRLLYDNLEKDVSNQGSLAEIILILAEYQYKHAFAADPEVNLTAMMVEIMSVLN